MTWKVQKKAYFLFVINLITRSKKICCMGRSLKNCGTIHCWTSWLVACKYLCPLQTHEAYSIYRAGLCYHYIMWIPFFFKDISDFRTWHIVLNPYNELVFSDMFDMALPLVFSPVNATCSGPQKQYTVCKNQVCRNYLPYTGIKDALSVSCDQNYLLFTF